MVGNITSTECVVDRKRREAFKNRAGADTCFFLAFSQCGFFCCFTCLRVAFRETPVAVVLLKKEIKRFAITKLDGDNSVRMIKNLTHAVMLKYFINDSLLWRLKVYEKNSSFVIQAKAWCSPLSMTGSSDSKVTNRVV